jgi:2-keto-3-deoxy-L-rhamnonate aldolase RhmA
VRANTLKQRLAAREPCRGIWLSLPSVPAARLLARMPADWILVDSEHGPMGAETMGHIVAAVADAGGAPIVRVAHGDVENIKRALDAGAWGILAPMVDSPEEAEAVVAAAKFPPEGRRSFGSAWAPLTLELSPREYRRRANEETLDPENAHATLREALDLVLRGAEKHRLPAGIYCSGPKAAEDRIRQGFLLVNVASDVGVLLSGIRAQLEWRPTHA